VIQAALLKLPETAEMPCEIRNFCQAGLLLKLAGPEAEKDLPKNRSGAEVVFTAAKTATTFHMEGRLSHVSASGVGFVFDLAPPFQVLQALQEKAVPNPLAEQKIPADLADIHGQCLQAFENALYPLLDSLPPQIQAGLAEEAAEQAASDGGGGAPPPAPEPEPPPPLAPIAERFYAHILEQAKSFIVPDLSLQPEAGAIYSESQSQRLMFEDWMSLIDKVILLETKYENVLRLLESRFSVFVQRDILNHDNPFGPNVICHSFHYSLQGVGLDNPQRNLVYEIFTRLLDERLAKLYGDLRILSKPLDALKKADAKAEPAQSNLFVGTAAFSPLKAPFPLLEEGAAAGSAASRLAPPREAAAAKKPAGTAGPPPAAPRIEYTPPPPDAFSAFVALFRYAESQAHKGPREAATDADRAAIIAALRKLQADAPASYFIAPRLQAGLSQILAETGQEKILSKTEIRENLQILGLLLDAMLADPAIPPCVAPYFKRLQIPLLAGSFIDPYLVHGHAHPGREILNQLDYLTQAANAQGDIDNAELLRSLDAIFDRAARVAGSQPHVFAEALAALEALTGPLMKAYAARLERVAEACEGGQRLEQARRLVDREIDARLGGKLVPSALLALLDAGWRQLLVLTNLRQGADNDDWRRQLAVVDLLMSWLAPKPPANPPSPLNVQGLKNYAAERLSSVGAEPAESGRILDKIEKLLLNGGGESHAPAYVEVPPADTALEEKQAALRDRLLGFREGEWLKFASTRGAWIPLRLAWIGQSPVRYVFANRKGIKTLDLDAVKFTQFLDEKRASRMENLDTLGVVERTAKALLSTLRDRLR
jgi:hypothetical protein